MAELRGRLSVGELLRAYAIFGKQIPASSFYSNTAYGSTMRSSVGGSSPIQLLGVHMFRYVATILVAILLSAPLVAGITPFPASFHTQMVATNGTSLYVRVGGKGPAVVLLHGFGDTGDMWAPLAIALAKDHTVIVPDLRGMGMSDHPDTGYTKKNQAVDIAGVMDALKIQKADLVTHDIGNMVGYALSAQYPDRVTRWVV